MARVDVREIRPAEHEEHPRQHARQRMQRACRVQKYMNSPARKTCSAMPMLIARASGRHR